MTLATLSLALLLWSVVGFWLAVIDAHHSYSLWIAPVWLRHIVMGTLQGPLWALLGLLWWYINLPRPDRD